MANVTINSLPTASTIDATNDLLPIYTNSLTATQAISRNTYLNLSSQPVGLTDSQTLTNKTLTSPTINGATLSGTLAGTYTIGGTPTFPSSVILTTGSQSLDSKTLTNSTITSPVITNATLSADTITGFTTSNSGTIYGLGVVSGILTTANTVSNTALSNTGTFGSAWNYTSFTPTISNFTFGNATFTAKYGQIGKLVNFYISIILGTTSVVGTGPVLTLPVTKSTGQNGGIGMASYFNGTNVYNGVVSSGGVLLTYNASATYTVQNSVTATVPFTWAATNVFTINGTYEAA